MLDGMIRAALGVINLTPEEAQILVRQLLENFNNMSKKMSDIDARLARIEKQLGIEQVELVEHDRGNNAAATGNGTGDTTGA